VRRVWITGAGVLSPIGSGFAAFADGCLAGVSGIGPITLFDARTFKHRIAGEVRDLDAGCVVQLYPAATRLRDRKVLLGLAAAEQAVAHAGLERSDLANTRSAVVLGAGLDVVLLDDIRGGTGDVIGAIATRLRELLADAEGWERLVPTDTAARLIAARHGLRGPCVTNVSACAAGAQAIGHALRLVREGTVDVALAGGADSMVHPMGVGGFGLLGALSPRNDPPGEALRPFDAARDGTVLGEGSAVLVLEEAERARARGTRPLAELSGYASTLDAHAVTDPEPTGAGALLAIRRALADAGIAPARVDYVSAHGTGTPKNDVVETAAIREALGPRALQIPVSALKSMTGHLVAASGAVEALSCVVALVRGAVPPTINLTRADPACDLDYVPGRARRWNGSVTISNSFGFGGQNAVLVIEKGGGS
jgi:3-oxoacyl-[acyl-carrier-protein] synthase II